jgi:hypothetical protein
MPEVIRKRWRLLAKSFFQQKRKKEKVEQGKSNTIRPAAGHNRFDFPVGSVQTNDKAESQQIIE